jgi:hypothetical protein
MKIFGDAIYKSERRRKRREDEERKEEINLLWRRKL